MVAWVARNSILVVMISVSNRKGRKGGAKDAMRSFYGVVVAYFALTLRPLRLKLHEGAIITTKIELRGVGGSVG